MIGSANRLLLCLAGTALVTACASPPAHFYTLTSTLEEPAGRTSAVTVAVGPASLPEAVNRPQMVLLTGPNQVTLDEFNRWAAPMQGEIQRVVMRNLTRLLETPGIFRYPQGPITDPDFRTQIEVLCFESAPGQEALLDVLWTVRGKHEKDGKHGRTTVREPLRDNSISTLVAAHSLALGTLSRDLADAILSLER